MDDQFKRNFIAYGVMKNELESKHFGRVALLHDGKLIGIYNDSGDTYAIGCEKFGLGNFSVEKIGEKPISLGIFTMCVPANNNVIRHST